MLLINCLDKFLRFARAGAGDWDLQEGECQDLPAEEETQWGEAEDHQGVGGVW